MRLSFGTISLWCSRSVVLRQLYSYKGVNPHGKRFFSKDDASSIPTFDLPEAHKYDVRAMLTKRTVDEFNVYLHVDINSTVQQALQQMTGSHARALIVLDGQDVCGIVTGRDYVRRVLAKGKNSEGVKCGDIMSKELTCIGLTDSLKKCMEYMTLYDHHHLPVLNTSDPQEFKGKYHKKDILTILTAKDIMRAILSVYYSGVFKKENPLKKILMGSVLKEKGYDYITLREAEPLIQTVKLMNELQIGSLLVSEGTQMTTGIITETDFVRKSHVFEKDGLEKCQAKDIMTCNPICITSDFTLDQALLLLLDRDFRHLPFIDFIGQAYDADTRCLGIVSITDILHVLSRDASKLYKKYSEELKEGKIKGTRLAQ
jgi:CBS domain-containing protein